MEELQGFEYLLLVEEGINWSRKAAMKKKGRDNLLFQTNKNFV